MPRAKSTNEFQITVKIPTEQIHLADSLATRQSLPGSSRTRTEVLRQAIIVGLKAIEEQQTSFEAEKRN